LYGVNWHAAILWVRFLSTLFRMLTLITFEYQNLYFALSWSRKAYLISGISDFKIYLKFRNFSVFAVLFL
jgi:hypothetical protein